MKKTFFSWMLLPLVVFAQPGTPSYRVSASVSKTTLNSLMTAAVESGALDRSEEAFIWTTVKARFLSASVEMLPAQNRMRMNVSMRLYTHLNTWPFDITDTRTINFSVFLNPFVESTPNGYLIRVCPEPGTAPDFSHLSLEPFVIVEVNKILSDPKSCQRIASFGTVLPNFPSSMLEGSLQFFVEADRLSLGLGIKAANLNKPSLVDYDGDGKADMSEITSYGDLNINYSRYGFGPGPDNVLTSPVSIQGKAADLDNDGLADLVDPMPGSEVFSVYHGSDDFAYPSYHYFGELLKSYSTIVPGDYDGDGLMDLAVFNNGSEAVSGYAIDFASNGLNGADWDDWYAGLPSSDHASPADYDGDGKTDLSLKNDWGQWGIDYASNGFYGWDVVYDGFGDANYIPVPGDYDGDGMADMAVMHKASPSSGWGVDFARNGFHGIDAWYNAGITYSYTKPTPSDYDGDGITDIAVKNDDGYWAIDYAADGFNGWDVVSGWWSDGSAKPLYKPVAKETELQNTGRQISFLFDLPKAANVRVEASSMNGSRIATLYTGNLSEGSNRVNWSREDLAAKGLKRGVYFLTLQAPGLKVSKRLVLTE